MDSCMYGVGLHCGVCKDNNEEVFLSSFIIKAKQSNDLDGWKAYQSRTVTWVCIVYVEQIFVLFDFIPLPFWRTFPPNSFFPFLCSHQLWVRLGEQLSSFCAHRKDGLGLSQELTGLWFRVPQRTKALLLRDLKHLNISLRISHSDSLWILYPLNLLYQNHG